MIAGILTVVGVLICIGLFSLLLFGLASILDGDDEDLLGD